MTFPVHDWQFWVVTLLAAGALAYLVRKLLPDRLKPWRKGPRGKATSLTISARTPPKKP
jgi:hypothetical protein